MVVSLYLVSNFSIPSLKTQKKKIKGILQIIFSNLCRFGLTTFKFSSRFCDPLLDSNADERASEREDYFQMFAGSPVSQLKKDTGQSRWKISKSHKGAHILRRIFSLFIKEIVEGMIGYVHLPTIMSKLLSDNGSQEFGDFKLTILGMLGTCGFERRILVRFCTSVLPLFLKKFNSFINICNLQNILSLIEFYLIIDKMSNISYY